MRCFTRASLGPPPGDAQVRKYVLAVLAVVGQVGPSVPGIGVLCFTGVTDALAQRTICFLAPYLSPACSVTQKQAGHTYRKMHTIHVNCEPPPPDNRKLIHGPVTKKGLLGIVPTQSTQPQPPWFLHGCYGQTETQPETPGWSIHLAILARYSSTRIVHPVDQ